MYKNDFFILLLSFTILNLYSQSENILEKFEEYTQAPREISYVHFNKSTYIKGEMFGFTAYILDKANKSLSRNTTNLYTTISDSNDSIIKEKLIRVNEGISYNTFKIDSLFTSGSYTLRAYTNWMLNFKEFNYFEHKFNVVDPEIQNEIKKTKNSDSYAIKILPEGGHLLADAENNLGIIVKNKNGIGLANASGKIINQNNELVSEFQLNAFGIAKTLIIPIDQDSYKIIISNDDKEIVAKITDIKSRGINMTLNQVKNGVTLTFRTNTNSFNFVKNKSFKIGIHNGNDLYLSDLSFFSKKGVNKFINKENLFEGINIITVFDDKNKPILERLYFNFNTIKPVNSSIEYIKEEKDSLSISLKLLSKDSISKYNNSSISILPSQTKSYNFYSAIFSKIYLEPYVKGFIQNSRYYFNNISKKTKYDLDCLLLTQGWSSYDWSQIFNYKPLFKHKYEKGISTSVNINGNDKSGNYLIFPLKNNSSEIITISANKTSFDQKKLYPEEGEYYSVTKTNLNGKKSKPKLYVNFTPSQIPKLNFESLFIHPSVTNFLPKNDFSKIKPAWEVNNLELLDEVLITAETEEATRIEKIKNSSYGNVRFLDEKIRRGMTLATYLDSYTPYRASEWDGYLRIIDPSPRFANNPIPYIILDGIIINNFEFLASFSLQNVDYIEVNRSGLGSGLRGGGGGYIKIVTDPVKFRDDRTSTNNKILKHKFPLAFNAPKKFYTPFYESYDSAFFKKYGTIAWQPTVKFDDSGKATFKIPKIEINKISLFIEGIINDNRFISEEIKIEK